MIQEHRKIAAIYNVWDDEHLSDSISSIRQSVDVVIVVYQNVSNFGEHYQPFIPSECDHIIHYTPDHHLGGTGNEKAKRNIGLEKAKELGCTHFILMDCDEIYHEKEFKYYRDLIFYNNCDASACRLYTYYKHPYIQLTPIEEYFVPFICRLYPETKVGYYNKFPVKADPTRMSSTFKNFYQINIPVMHHYSWVRTDIGRKIRNSSAGNLRKHAAQILKDFNSFDETGKLAIYPHHSWIDLREL